MSRRFSIFLNVYSVVVFVGIGGLQMRHVNAGLLTNYGADALAPPIIYFAFRGGRIRLRPFVSFAVVLAACFLWEWSQRYDLRGTPLVIAHGTFDPYDLVAYTVGLLAVYAIDLRWLSPKGIVGAPPTR